MRRKPEQYRPFASGYVSEFDQFMQHFLNQHPEMEEDRQRGWYLLWDHRVDLDDLARQRQDSVPVKPYGYE